MSGPPFPRSLFPSGIGEFKIGVSPIGAVPPFDWWQTVLAQYANSPTLTQLISNFFQYLDQTADFELFFENIWDIDTASGIGLDIWGRIVGVVRALQVNEPGKFFGFEEATSVSADPFNQSPFFSGTTLTTNFSLADSSFRTLIFAKALANISDGSIPSINQLLLNLFPDRGNCFVTDNGGMSMDFVFEFPLSSVEIAIVSQSGVLPKPAGVSATVIIGQPPPLPSGGGSGVGQLKFNVKGQSGWIPEVI